MKAVTFFRTRKLTDDEWEALSGSSLYEAMFRNKLCANLNASHNRNEYRDAMKKWLDENCKGRYYIARTFDPLAVFFELEAEQILFEKYFSEDKGPDTTLKTQDSLAVLRDAKRRERADSRKERGWDSESFGN